jgi:hypothetical protein
VPFQNRVDPFGELIATAARGTLLGNRGGRLHDSDRKLTTRRWTSKAWICCKLDFNNRHRDVWGNGYTEMFFLDEVTAFAAGHRPCFECRRKDAERFARLFAVVGATSAHSRASGNPGLGPRFRGDEKLVAGRATAKTMDDVLHGERLAGKDKRIHRRALDDLPDGAMVALAGEPFAVRGRQMLRWTPSGYSERRPRLRDIEVDGLTPPSIMTVLARGYTPLWHPSAA